MLNPSSSKSTCPARNRRSVRASAPLLFSLFWLSALVWNAYWFLWRFGHSMEVNGTQVTWRSTLRTRQVTLTDLTGNEWAWLGWTA